MAPLIVLAAGGTGGHVFPAEALAAELLARGLRLALVTDKRGQAYGGTLGSLETHRISAGGVAGRGLASRLRGLAELAWGAVQAGPLLRRLNPAAVIGFGGYASLPTMLAASRAGLPTLIHEQNAVLGRANRLLAGRVGRVATCYAAVRHLPAEARVVQTGMPVRPAIAALRDTPYERPDGALRLLVLGGSQGARVLSEVLPSAMALLPETLRARIAISQQCRPEDIGGAREAFAALGMAPTLETFFRDVPERLAAAHLVVARAGASTVAELTALGRPAILVPYPHAVDDHQTANAHALDEAGGGWLMPQPAFTPEALAARVRSLFELPDTLVKAAACARAAGRPDAARRLADSVMEAMP